MEKCQRRSRVTHRKECFLCFLGLGLTSVTPFLVLALFIKQALSRRQGWGSRFQLKARLCFLSSANPTFTGCWKAFEEERFKEPNPGLAVSGKSCLKWVFEALFRHVLLRVVYMICSKLEILNGITSISPSSQICPVPSYWQRQEARRKTHLGYSKEAS